MDNPNNNGEYQYKKSEYDALANKTYETLDRSVFNADIGNPKLGLSDTIREILPTRIFIGKNPIMNPKSYSLSKSIPLTHLNLQIRL